MTRALGDADVKGDGVTPDPEVTETTLTPRDEYFVMACDGLWDVVSNEEAVAMIKVNTGDNTQPNIAHLSKRKVKTKTQKTRFHTRIEPPLRRGHCQGALHVRQATGIRSYDPDERG